MTHAEQGNTAQERLERLMKYLEYTPGNVNLLADAVATAIEAGDLNAADAAIKTTLAANPTSAEHHAHAGLLYLQLNAHSSAHECLQLAVSEGLDDIAIGYNLAYSQYQLRQFEDALATLARFEPSEDLKKAISLLQARCKFNTDQLQEAVADIESFLKEQPGDSDAEGLLALLLCDLERLDAALIHANRALNQDPLCFDALIARANVFMSSRSYHSAHSDFIKATTVNPQSGRAWSGLGQIDFYNFEFDSALEHLQKAVHDMPDHIGTWHLLGWTWLMKEEQQKALEAFEAAYKLDRNFGETHGALASVYALTGEHIKAEKHIKLAKKLAPEGFGQVYASMVLLNQQNKQQDSQTLFDKLKATHYQVLGTTPSKLIEARLKELSEKPKQH